MRQRLTLGQLETARANLDALPPPDDSEIPIDLQDAIRKLAPTIRKLLARGYSREQVAAFLAQSGINISPGTLKDYLGGRRKQVRGAQVDDASAGVGLENAPQAAARHEPAKPASIAPHPVAENPASGSRPTDDTRPVAAAPARRSGASAG